MRIIQYDEREEQARPARDFEPEEIDLVRLLPRLRERQRLLPKRRKRNA